MPRKKYRPTQAEMKQVKKERMIEEVVTLVLEARTDDEITEIMKQAYPDFTEARLRSILTSPEYKTALENAIAEMRKDPRREAVVQSITSLLPLAAQKVRDALLDKDAPWNAVRWAVEKVFTMAHLNEAAEDPQSDAEKLKDFLRKINASPKVVIENVEINQLVPPEYLSRLRESLPDHSEIVDAAEVTDLGPEGEG